MSKFQAFMKQNKKGAETVKFKLPNFGDAEFELRILTGEENETIQQKAMRNRAGKSGRQEQYFDATTYNRDLCMASLVVPNLRDTELQESYGAHGEKDLFGKMFNFAEQGQILALVTQVSGLDKDINDFIVEAKN